MRLTVRNDPLARVFDDFLSNSWLVPPNFAQNKLVVYPRVHSKDGILTLAWDMPGVRETDLEVQLELGLLSVKAKRYDLDEKIEHSYRFQGDRYDLSSATAALTDGVLTIKVKEHESQRPRKITVAVNK